MSFLLLSKYLLYRELISASYSYINMPFYLLLMYASPNLDSHVAVPD